MGNDTTASDRGLDERVELFVAADSELKVTGRDPLHLEILAGVSSELEHLSGEVLEDGRRVDGGRSTNTAASADPALEEPVDSANRELTQEDKQIKLREATYTGDPYLESGTRRPRLRVLLVLSDSELAAFAAFSAFATGLLQSK